MITRYLIDQNGVYISEVTLNAYDAIPANSVGVEPPLLDGNQAAQWIGAGWVVLQEYPEAPQPPAPDPKMVGVEILGVMCSATNQDQSGLSAVALGVTIARSNGQTFPATRFEFANGNSLVITDANFNAIYSAWVPFRQSFFAVAD